MCGFVFSSSKFSKSIDEILDGYESISYRGPDSSIVKYLENGVFLGFHRLSIMDLSSHGEQPFQLKDKYLMCNGEIYNYQDLKERITSFKYQSGSDCEVILPYLRTYGLEKLVKDLDGEYAFVIYDEKKDSIIAARDPMGIRPLFYGFTKKDKSICFASEAKALIKYCDDIKPFPPGHYYHDGNLVGFHSYEKPMKIEEKDIAKGIHDHLFRAIEKRLQSDAPVGFLLSGGLDSSIVCAVAAKLSDKPITTFSVGIDKNPIDVKYAREVAKHIGSDHHEVIFTRNEALDHLSGLIHKLETWDITTIRAAMGMSMVCKYIKEKTDIKVVLTGEVSDEIFGYKYTDFAPSPEEFQKEARKRVEEIYMYDVLRADRSISSHSLEARVPFSDKDFVDFVMSTPPKFKMNSTGVGKYLLRKAFDRDDYLPQDILFREKAAFSDAVGHSLVDWLKEYAEETYTDKDLEAARFKYKHATPFTKESLLYRDIFEGHFPGMGHLIKDFWMPNKEWDNCDVEDPSARVLPNYGTSGV
jgi:asparagine synthase (glutamine-hydrolysing)